MRFVTTMVVGLAIVCSACGSSTVENDAVPTSGQGQATTVDTEETTTGSGPSTAGSETSSTLESTVPTDDTEPGSDSQGQSNTDTDGTSDGNGDAREPGSGTGSETGAGVCRVETVPVSAGLDPFYTQGCGIDGLRVVAGAEVDPVAVNRTADTVMRLLSTDDRLAPAIAGAGVRVGVIGRDQRTTEMPEYRDLYEAFPDTDWDNRARGLGATVERPLVSVGEENVLCLPDDPYLGEDILIHELAHTLDQFGYSVIDPDFSTKLVAAYDAAMSAGTWDDTYAATNPAEYWAEGVQSYLGRNLTADPVDGVHGPIGTAQQLREADPALFDLIDQRLQGLTLPPQCPTG